jgi:molybdate transport system substrate-binding protein
MKRRLALAAVLTLSCACSSANADRANRADRADNGSTTGKLRIYAASSLTEAFDSLKREFVAAHPGAKVTITYGASSDLATQITQGAPADVFASASEKNMTALGAAAVHPTDFAANTLTIAVPPGNPAKITAVGDLAKRGVKVAVCDPAVPCGVVAAKVFANAGIRVTPTASEPDVKSVLAAVESGEVDAGLVYVTDVRAAGSKVVNVPIPAAVNASTTYPIAALKDAHSAGLATAFVDLVVSAAGRRVLAADGFSRP